MAVGHDELIVARLVGCLTVCRLVVGEESLVEEKEEREEERDRDVAG
jgi:hypothetical protein